MTFARELGARFGSAARTDVPLAPFTTFRVGGLADWLLTVRGATDLDEALRLAREWGIGVTVLGGGSNVLVSDEGVRGLVIRLAGGEVVRAGEGLVRADAGVTVNGLVRWTINRGLAGLEIWAGTPGTIGGALYGNAHFQGHLIGDAVDRVRLMASDGTSREISAREMEFAYDRSRLQRTREIVVWATFGVSAGDPAKLRARARASLAFRKRTQPLNLPSAGCIFQNPDPAVDRLPDDMPPSAGALVDRAGLKGASSGGAWVSSVHANFIVTDGHATARDIARLVRRCRQAVADRFGVQLRDEIVYLGHFDEDFDEE